MTAHDDTPTDATPTPPRDETAGARRLLLAFRSGPHAFGVYADDADGLEKFTRATPLPFAPPPVLGVISARGRMRTLIDPRRLLKQEPNDAASANEGTASADEETTPPALALILKGDEQLALAVGREADTLEISPADLTPPDPPQDFAHGTLEHEGTRVLVLNPARLFEAAVRGAERRRPR